MRRQDLDRQPWDAAADDRLRALWAGPLSAAAIGAAMRRSKAAVVGRAHRLGLPSRPSPIRAARGSSVGAAAGGSSSP